MTEPDPVLSVALVMFQTSVPAALISRPPTKLLDPPVIRAAVALDPAADVAPVQVNGPLTATRPEPPRVPPLTVSAMAAAGVALLKLSAPALTTTAQCCNCPLKFTLCSRADVALDRAIAGYPGVRVEGLAARSGKGVPGKLLNVLLPVAA